MNIDMEKLAQLETAILRFQVAWQQVCDGTVKAPVDKGFEDHRACYDLIEMFHEYRRSKSVQI